MSGDLNVYGGRSRVLGSDDAGKCLYGIGDNIVGLCCQDVGSCSPSGVVWSRVPQPLWGPDNWVGSDAGWQCLYVRRSNIYSHKMNSPTRDAGGGRGCMFDFRPGTWMGTMFICDDSQTYVSAQVKDLGARNANFRTVLRSGRRSFGNLRGGSC